MPTMLSRTWNRLRRELQPALGGVQSASERPTQTPRHRPFARGFVAKDIEAFNLLAEIGFRPLSILDVGASNGWWSRAVAVYSFPTARYDLFEPCAEISPKYAEGLKEALAANPNFRLHPCALGDRDGVATIHSDAQFFGSSTLEIGANANFAQHRVPMATLDGLLAAGKIVQPDLIKIDTQGSELRILQGAARCLERTQVLALECWIARDYGPQTPILAEMVPWLAERGFHLWDIADCYRNADGVLISQDCIFVNRRCRFSALYRPTLRDKVEARLKPASVAPPIPPPKQAEAHATETAIAPPKKKGFADDDREKLLLLKKLGWAPAAVCDVGASNGWWSRVMAGVFPEARYDLFEPLADVSPDYKKLLGEALAAHPNFVLHKTAAGAAPGVAKMWYSADFFGSSTLEVPPHLRHGFQPLEAPIARLDDLIAAGKAATPQLLKMDVQGGELNVLRGAERTLPNVDVIFVESWLRRSYGEETPLFAEMTAWLAARGFDIWDFSDCYRDERGVAVTQDAVWMNRRCGLSRLKG
jgi:FkbM family methyltransferase